MSCAGPCRPCFSDSIWSNVISWIILSYYVVNVTVIVFYDTRLRKKIASLVVTFIPELMQDVFACIFFFIYGHRISH